MDVREASVNRKYTLQDVHRWSETGNQRWELIEGLPNLMTSPSPVHQEVVLQMAARLLDIFTQTACRVYLSPLDFMLFADEHTPDEHIDTVVQPDIFIMCNRPADAARIVGIPELVIEVVSPSSVRTDRVQKYELYQKAGVKEYWIVYPLNQSVELFTLEDGTFRLHRLFTREDTVQSCAFPELSMDMKSVFTR